MATTATPSAPGGLANALWRRQLARYPDTGPRYLYLGIVVLTTITLYYLYYVEGAVTPLMLPGLHMSFQFFLYLLVVSNAIGAFTAFIGGLSDKIGRANLTIYGTLIVGLLQLVAVPNIGTSKWMFSIIYSGIGFVEGIILVSTPALIRDFSPQMGRAAAMGFWALGPVLGSLAASEVATRTLPHLHPWQDQFIISGVACMAVVVVAFFGLRELAPQLRDQLMVSERERALIEARARGIDVEAAIAHPLRSILKLELLSSSFAVAVFLLIYYASVSVLTIYWAVVFNRTPADANGINTWYWSADAIALIVFGLASDRLRVRKPFMAIGALGTIVMTIVMVVQAGHPHASYYDNVVVVVLLGVFIALAYTPWMAGYTEAIEAHNPALVATGLAVWGWVLRIVVAISFLVLPAVITTATTLVDHYDAGQELRAFQAATPYAPSLTKLTPPVAPPQVIDNLASFDTPGPQTLATILRTYASTHNALAAVNAAGGLSNNEVQGLLAFATIGADIQAGHAPAAADLVRLQHLAPDLAQLAAAEQKLVPAQAASPGEWKRWWWVCLGGQVVFLLLVFAMRGRWSPRAARADFEEYERKVEEELARLAPAAAAGGGA